MWYDPARSGEGLQLEILTADSALVEWFTYNEQGGQRWFQGIGKIVHSASNDTIEFPQLYVTSGGHFGPDFNPSDVKVEVEGDATLSFSDCSNGSFQYHAYGQTQTLPVQRLTQTMGAGCTSINGIPGQPVMAYAGQSGSWYDVSHSGEGFELQWLTNNQAMVIWYTYDTSGNQVWLLGVGNEQDGAIVFEQMARTSGPHFGTAYDPASYQAEDWGTLTLQLDCNTGTAHYASSQTEFGSGDLTLSRLTTLQSPNCPTVVQPKLSDLYDITWDELPIEIGTPQNPTYLSAEAIAKEGTIAGRRDGHLVLWHPDTKIWEDIPRDISHFRRSTFRLMDRPSSRPTCSATWTTDTTPNVHTLMWQRSTGWQTLEGDILISSLHRNVSHNFQYIVGGGLYEWDGA